MLGEFDRDHCVIELFVHLDLWFEQDFLIEECNRLNLTMTEVDLILKKHLDDDELVDVVLMYRQKERKVLWEYNIVESNFVDQNRKAGRILLGILRRYRYFLHPRHLDGFSLEDQV